MFIVGYINWLRMLQQANFESHPLGLTKKHPVKEHFQQAMKFSCCRFESGSPLLRR